MCVHFRQKYIARLIFLKLCHIQHFIENSFNIVIFTITRDKRLTHICVFFH